jgi:hypothetical protein
MEVRSAILYATVIIVLVFVPLFALPGMEGRLFVPLGVAFIARRWPPARLGHRDAGAGLLPAAAHEEPGAWRHQACWPG